MEYNDNKLSSPDEFALLAKEYNEKLKRSKLESQKLFESLYLLNWIYGFISKHIRVLKTKNRFREFEKQISCDISLLFSELNSTFEKQDLEIPKRIPNLRFCLQFALENETVFLRELIPFLDDDKPILREVAFSHLNLISSLSKYI